MKKRFSLLLVFGMLFCLTFVAVNSRAAAASSGSTITVKQDGTGDYTTISAAVQNVEPGDTVEVYGGTYREQVEIPRGGNSDSSRVTLKAASGETVIITGSDLVGTSEWTADPDNDGVYILVKDNTDFGDFNPFDEWWKSKGSSYSNYFSCGCVYMNGEALAQKWSADDVDSTDDTWYAVVGDDQTTIYANFGGLDPTDSSNVTEINVREQCVKAAWNQGYITIDGLTAIHGCGPKTIDFWKTTASPMNGAIATNGGYYWIIENCELYQNRGVAIDYGNGSRMLEDDNGGEPALYGHHIIRYCKVHDNATNGMMAYRGAYTEIYGCTLANNNTLNTGLLSEAYIKDVSGGFGINIHNNYLYSDQSWSVYPIWLDSECDNCRVSQNVFYCLGGGKGFTGIFFEVNGGYNLCDNNVFIGMGWYIWTCSHTYIVNNLWLNVNSSVRKWPAYAAPYAGGEGGDGYTRAMRAMVPGTLDIISTCNNTTSRFETFDRYNKLLNNIFFDYGPYSSSTFAEPSADDFNDTYAEVILSDEDGVDPDYTNQSSGYPQAWVEAYDDTVGVGTKYYGNECDYNVYYGGADVINYQYATNRGYTADANSKVVDGGSYSVTATSDYCKLTLTVDDTPTTIAAPAITGAYLGETTLYEQLGYDVYPPDVDTDFFGNARSSTDTVVGPFANLKSGRNTFVLWSSDTDGSSDNLTYTIDDISNQSLDIVSEGYSSGSQETRTVTITNSGTGDLTNLATTVSGSDASSFSVSQPSATTVYPGGSTTFIVMAKDSLAAGTYTATITVSADNVSSMFTVTQQVDDTSLSTVATPAISPSAGTYNSQWVTITCATSGAEIRYTTDGDDPTSSSTLYESPISLSTGTTTVKAKAFLDGYNSSAIASAAYTISGTVNKYQTGDGSTTLTLKTAQNFEGDLSVEYDTASLWLGKGTTGMLSDLWLYYPDLIGSDDGQIPSGCGIVSAQLVLTVKGFDGNAYLAHKMDLYQITDPNNLGTPYFGSDGVGNGLDYLYRDHRTGKNLLWKTGAANISSLFTDSDPTDTYELIPESFTEEGYTQIRLDVTDSVQAWADGEANQGWFLTGDSASTWAYDDGIEFYGVTATTVANRPKLEVCYVSSDDDYTAPDAVEDLTPTAGDGQVDLAWTNPSDFTGVVILRKAGVIPADPTDGTVVYDGTDSSYTDTGLTNDTTYYYAAFAYDDLRNYSKKAYTKAVPTSGSGTPTAPSGLSVSESGTNIVFGWTDNSSNETYFLLQQKEGTDGTWSTVACPAAGETSLTAALTDSNFGLTPSTTYYYRLSAVNDLGSSDYATCSWTTSAFLQAPTDLTWTIVSSGKVNLTWTNAATDATAIRVDLYSADTDTVLSSTSLATTATSCSVTGLQAGTEYYIKVVAIRSTEEAAASTEVFKTTTDSKGGLL